MAMINLMVMVMVLVIAFLIVMGFIIIWQWVVMGNLISRLLLRRIGTGIYIIKIQHVYRLLHTLHG